MPRRPKGTSFDDEYFAKYYGDPHDRVHGPTEVAHLGEFIRGFAAWSGLELRSVLDVGAGPGFFRDWCRKHLPDATIRSVDLSPAACARFDHEQRDIVTWRAAEKFDLVVCHSVLQYLPDADCAKAIANLAAMCRGLLYLEAVTKGDLAARADPSLTDMGVQRRSGAWYRKALKPHFQQVGAGLWAARRAGLVFWELEATGP